MRGRKVYELAREAGMSSKELLALLRQLNIEVKSHMSVVDAETMDLIKKRLGGVEVEEEVGKKLKKEEVKREKEEVKKVEAKREEVKKKEEVKEELIEKIAEKVVEKATPPRVVPVPEVPLKVKEVPSKVVKKAPPKRMAKAILAERIKSRSALKEMVVKPVPKEVPVEAPPKEVKREKVVKRKVVKINESVAVGELAKKMDVKASDLIKKLMEYGVMAAINQSIDAEIATAVASEFGYEAQVVPLFREDLIAEEVDEPSALLPRSPVVTIMGHVDHGKTSLLDAIRQTNVTAQEAGGITQHIGAYQVKLPQGTITLLDTPGHEAFTAMRARGAKVTDLVVLVVAADDGVMPQTIEAIDHARAANVPIVVAVNKIDKPEAQPERVKQQLTNYGLIPEEWGGKTICVEVSAKKGMGLENLLEMILLEAEMLELKANPKRLAKGTVIEAKLDRGRGPVATVLVQNGTLKVGDAFVAGQFYGKVKALINDRGERVSEAGPSIPVEVIGFSGVPQAGDIFQVVEDERKARQVSFLRQEAQRAREVVKVRHITLDDLYKQIQEGEIKELPLIIKGDVQGSIEPLKESLERLSTDRVKIKVIHAGVGGITETDVMLASASNAIIIGFNVQPEMGTEEVAQQEKVDIRLYQVIYDVVSDVKAAMEGLLKPSYREVSVGKAEVRQIFKISKVGTVAGSYVLEGEIPRSAKVKVVRDNQVVYEGKIASLRRFKEDVKEVPAGYECGIALENYEDVQVGDILEAFLVEEVVAKL